MKNMICLLVVFLAGWLLPSVSPAQDAGALELLSLLEQTRTLKSAGHYEEAEKVARRAVAQSQSALGRESLAHFSFVRELAQILKQLREFTESERLLLETLTFVERSYGSAHVYYATAEVELAELYVAWKRPSKAEPLFAQALATKEKELGAEHEQTAIAASDLGMLLQQLGRSKEADALLARSLRVTRLVLGEQHREVAAAMLRLWVGQVLQGASAAAQPLYDQARQIMSNPDVDERLQELLDVLGASYFRQNHPAAAAALFERALEIRQGVAPHGSPEVVINFGNLVEADRAMGAYDDAEARAERGRAYAQTLSDPTHPALALILNNLAGVYIEQTRFPEAIPLFERALSIRETRLGAQHPLTITTRKNLATVKSAGSPSGRAPSGQAEGPPEISLPAGVASLVQQAHGLRIAGFYDEAERLLQRALSMLESAFGGKDPRVSLALNHLGVLYRAWARYDEAERYILRAKDIVETLEGSEGAGLASVLNNLAVVYTLQLRYDEAERVLDRAMELDRNRLPPNHPDIARTLNNRAALHTTRQRFAAADADYLESIRIAEQAPERDDLGVAVKRQNLAGSLARRGRYEEAAAQYQQALGLLQGDLLAGPDAAIILLGLGTTLSETGRLGEAEPVLQQAQRVAESLWRDQHPDAAAVLNGLGGLYRAMRQDDQAETAYRRALHIAENTLGPSHPSVAGALSNLAELYRTQSRLDEATKLYERVLSILGDGVDAVLLNNQANLYMDRGELANAERLYRRAIAIRTDAVGADHPTVAHFLGNLGFLLNKQGRLADALGTFRQATAIMKRRGAGSAIRRSMSTLAEQVAARDLYLAQIDVLTTLDAGGERDLAAQRAGSAEAFELAQFAMQSRTSATLARVEARLGLGDTKDAMAIKRHHNLVEDWRLFDAKRTAELARPSSTERRRNVTRLSERLAALENEIEAFDRAAPPGYRAFLSRLDADPIGLDRVKTVLDANEALLVFLVREQVCYLWVVSREGSGMLRLPVSGRELTRAVQALRIGLDPDRLEDFDVNAAYQLYQNTLQPVAGLLGKGIDHLLIVPDGALASIPFSVMVTAAPEVPSSWQFSDYRAVAWLGTHKAITVLPSVDALKRRAPAGEGNAPRVAGGHVIGIGAPVLAGPAAGGERPIHPAADPVLGLADPAWIRTLPAIPGAAEMLSQMLTRFVDRDGVSRATVLRDEDANEAAIKRLDFSKFSTIVFVTHGLTAEELPGIGEPALVMTPPTTPTPEDDGLLTESEIQRLNLNADFVILTACNTAAPSGALSSTSLSGLARAFIDANARSLLVSHWPVNVRAGLALTSELQRRQPTDRAEALRLAMQALIDDPENPSFAHPALWAPFSYVSDGSRFEP